MESTKYAGVGFQGKTGSLSLTSDKVIFRPRQDNDNTNDNKNKDEKPMARSWRWAVIDRVDVLDQARGSSDRTLKLKAKGSSSSSKAVSLTVPGSIFHDVLQDVERRLAAKGSGGGQAVTPTARPTTPASPRGIAANINRVDGKGRRYSTSDALAKDKNATTTVTTAVTTKATTKRSSIVTTSPTIKPAPIATVIKRTSVTTTSPASKPVSPPKKKSPVPLWRRNSKPEEGKLATSPFILADKEKEHVKDDSSITSWKRISTKNQSNRLLSVKSPLSILKPKMKQALLGNNKPSSSSGNNCKDVLSDMDKKSSKHSNNSDNNVEHLSKHKSSGHSSSSSTKRPLLHFLKAPPIRRNITAELKAAVAAEKMAAVKTKTTASTSKKTKGPAKDDALNDSLKDIIFTPPQAPKEKLCIHGWSPQEMLTGDIFTPRTQNKGKVTDNTNSPQTANTTQEEDPEQDIAFTPTARHSKGKVDLERQDIVSAVKSLEITADDDSSGSEYSGSEFDDSTAVSDASSRSSGASSELRFPEYTKTTKQEMPHNKNHNHNASSPSDEDDDCQLFDPEDPENKFRMMLFKHSAACPQRQGSKQGACPYDPVCSEYSRVLRHVESCHDPECNLENCQSTKDFLMTMEMMQNHEESAEKKDYLVSVGAVAPLSYVHVEWRRGSYDAYSAVSDGTWLSNKDLCGGNLENSNSNMNTNELEIM